MVKSQAQYSLGIKEKTRLATYLVCDRAKAAAAVIRMKAAVAARNAQADEDCQVPLDAVKSRPGGPTRTVLYISDRRIPNDLAERALRKEGIPFSKVGPAAAADLILESENGPQT